MSTADTKADSRSLPFLVVVPLEIIAEACFSSCIVIQTSLPYFFVKRSADTVFLERVLFVPCFHRILQGVFFFFSYDKNN